MAIYQEGVPFQYHVQVWRAGDSGPFSSYDCAEDYAKAIERALRRANEEIPGMQLRILEPSDPVIGTIGRGVKYVTVSRVAFALPENISGVGFATELEGRAEVRIYVDGQPDRPIHTIICTNPRDPEEWDGFMKHYEAARNAMDWRLHTLRSKP